MPDSQLTRIPGIGPATARTLTDSGFASVEAIAKAATEDLARVPGFGSIRAAVVITSAQTLVTVDGGEPVTSAAPEKADKAKGKKKKKKKNKKKDKKKDKGKSKKKGKKKTSKKKRKK